MPYISVSKIPYLVDCVKKRPALYDFDASQRAIRDEIVLRQKLWEEVANEIDASVTDIKATWTKLRCTLRKEQLKGSDSSWIWYKSMEFFAPYMHKFSPGGTAKKEGNADTPTGGHKMSLPASLKSPPPPPKHRLSGGKIKKGYAAKSTTQKPRKFIKPLKTSPAVTSSYKSSPSTNRVTPSSHYMSRETVPPSISTTLPTENPKATTTSAAGTVTGTPATAGDSLSLSDFMSPPAVQKARQSNNHGMSPAASIAPSTVTSAPDDDTAVGDDKNSLRNFTEYHFVSCLLEMLEDVPSAKRGLVKARIMAEIAKAYQL